MGNHKGENTIYAEHEKISMEMFPSNAKKQKAKVGKDKEGGRGRKNERGKEMQIYKLPSHMNQMRWQ